MINGIHIITYAEDAEKARTFFRDVLGLASVDAGGGWLIFALPPAEIAAHPLEAGEARSPEGQPRHGLYLMCDDIHGTVAELQRKGVEFSSPVMEMPWGLLTMLMVPGAGAMGLYEPRHPVAIGLGHRGA